MIHPPVNLPQLLRRLDRWRRLARLVLWVEALWPVLWPPLGVVGLFLCLALVDVFLFLPVWAHIAILAAFAGSFAALLGLGLRRVVVPDSAAADRRLERASGLSHRPLATLADRPAGSDPGAQALWQAHVARAAGQLVRLRVGRLSPGLPGRDRRALRGALVVALVASFAIAGDDSWPRILRSLTPDVPVGRPGTTSLVQAWITPPAYTGVAPVFLKPQGDEPGAGVAVPAGSHLTVSVTGGLGEPSLTYGGHTEKFQTLDAGSFQAERDLLTGGHLAVRRLGRSVGAWDITAITDAPPTVAFADPPGQAPRSVQTRLPWVASDDYGVTSLQAEIRLRDRPGVPPLIVAIPLAGTPKSAHGTAQPDLSAHPWAGLPVIARLVVHDFPGQSGRSDDAEFVLPERFFHNPVARAVIAVRRGLSEHPENRDAAIRDLAVIADSADPVTQTTFANDAGAYVNLRAIGGLLHDNAAPAAVDEAQDRLWQLALHLEEGGAERTARALEAAREAVRQQLEALRNEPKAVTPAQQAEHNQKLAELQRRMQALREAIQQHLQALAEQARREGAVAPEDPSQPQVDSRALDKMAQQMQRDAQEGHMAEAEQEMAQLEQMLQQLKNARPQRPQDRQNAQRQQRGRQQMNAVQDMVQRQTGLLDHSQARQPTQESQDQQDQTAAPPDQQRPDTVQRQADARVQHALRRALGELMQQSGDLTGEVPSALSDADTAMREAGRALEQSQDDAAGAAQQRAIEALQKGGQQMAQSMSRQFGMSMQLNEGDGQDGGAGDQANGQDPQYGDGDSGMQSGREGSGGLRRDGQRDPLGRLTQDGSSGSDESSDVHVPDQMERARTRDIQNELRRRGAERSRPEDELQYIDRLLKPF